MPPKAKITKDNIIEAALAIAEKKGLSSITARSVAKELGCSVAPIYVNFETMDELTGTLMKKIALLSEELLAKQKGDDYFERIGKASLAFARQYPVIFREMALLPKNRQAQDEMQTGVLAGMAQEESMKGWSLEERKRLLLKMSIFQLGLALMVANNSLPTELTDRDQEDLLMETGEELYSVQRMKKENSQVLKPFSLR